MRWMSNSIACNCPVSPESPVCSGCCVLANFALRQSIEAVRECYVLLLGFIKSLNRITSALIAYNAMLCVVDLVKLKFQNMLDKIVKIKAIHSEVKMLLNEIKRLKMQKESIEKQIALVEKTIENKLDESFKLSIEVDDINTEFLIKNNQ